MSAFRRGRPRGGAVFTEDGELLVAALQRAVVVKGTGVPLGLGNWAA
jgi:hypothetical protein